MEKHSNKNDICNSKWCIFSYGSNSITQLRARVENNKLTAIPAVCNNFSRCFCYKSAKWGGGGVATICPCPNSSVRGACVFLTNLEKERLDQYEGGYRMEEVEVIINCTENIRAFAYVAGLTKDKGGYTLPMTAEPSEEYLTAIHVMLREQWNMEGETIAIRTYNSNDNTVTLVKEYKHPTSILELSLEALCVEINTYKHSPWKMPASIKKNVELLSMVIPKSEKDKYDSRRLYGYQLAPYFTLLESLLDGDSYQALKQIFRQNVQKN
jgi:hypothetical protein